MPRILVAILLLLPHAARANPIPDPPAGVAAFVGQATQGPLDTPTLVYSLADFHTVFGSSTAGLSLPWLEPSAAAFFANGGGQLYVVRVAGGDDASLIGQDGGPGARTGLQSLLGVNAPGVVAAPGASSAAVHQALVAHAVARGDRMALLDPAATDDVAAALARRNQVAAPDGHAALYFPWVVDASPGGGRALPPSGYAAGLYALVDPDDSPVGPLVGATGVTVVASSAEYDQLNQAGVNAIRDFGSNGIRVFGARTLGGGDWLYVAVRRVGLHLQEAIQEGTAWATGEANDPTLWSQLETCTDAYMYGKWQQGWFQGTSPGEAWFVRCDGSTMTQSDLDAGRTVMLVGFAPLKPAEFVLLRFVHERSATGAPTPARGAARLLPAVPNPFNPRTTLSFELDRPGPATLELLDLRGRRVRTLPAGTLAAGRHELGFDGLDDRGTPLASGGYRVRLLSPLGTDSQGVLLLR